MHANTSASTPPATAPSTMSLVPIRLHSQRCASGGAKRPAPVPAGAHPSKRLQQSSASASANTTASASPSSQREAARQGEVEGYGYGSDDGNLHTTMVRHGLATLQHHDPASSPDEEAVPNSNSTSNSDSDSDSSSPASAAQSNDDASASAALPNTKAHVHYGHQVKPLHAKPYPAQSQSQHASKLLPSSLDNDVRNYCCWLRSLYTDPAWKKDVDRAFRVVWKDRLDLTLLRKEEPAYLIRKDIPRGIAWHVVKDIDLWLVKYSREAVDDETIEEN